MSRRAKTKVPRRMRPRPVTGGSIKRIEPATPHDALAQAGMVKVEVPRGQAANALVFDEPAVELPVTTKPLGSHPTMPNRASDQPFRLIHPALLEDPICQAGAIQICRDAS